MCTYTAAVACHKRLAGPFTVMTPFTPLDSLLAQVISARRKYSSVAAGIRSNILLMTGRGKPSIPLAGT